MKFIHSVDDLRRKSSWELHGADLGWGLCKYSKVGDLYITNPFARKYLYK